MRTSGLGERRGSSTKGVWPIDSTMSPKRPPQGLLSRSSKAIVAVPYFKKYSRGRPRRRAITKKTSTAGHRRQDDDGVAVGDRRLETLEHAHVLVVEVDVDVAVEVAVLAEELLGGGGVIGGEGAQDLADVGAGRL